MKRIASGLLALVLAFSLCACGAETASSSLPSSAESSTETTKTAAAPAANDDAMAKTAVTDGTKDVENDEAPDAEEDAVAELGDLLDDGASPSASSQEKAMQKLIDYLLEDGSEITELEGSGIKIPHSLLNTGSGDSGDVSALAARPGDSDLYYYTILSGFTQVGILSGDTFTFQLSYEDYTMQGMVDIGTYQSGDSITLIKSDFPIDPPDSLLTSVTDLAFSMVNLCAVSAGVTMQELGFTYYDSDDSSSTAAAPDAATAFSGTSSGSADTASATTGEKNALDSAKSYLNAMAFSYDGLVDQLEYEGFTHSEAVYGADHCGADWMEQAARMAEEYLNSGSFSRSGLIDQLEYEGFTNAQAVYGAEQNGY